MASFFVSLIVVCLALSYGAFSTGQVAMGVISALAVYPFGFLLFHTLRQGDDVG
jgi:hypothetical protein